MDNNFEQFEQNNYEKPIDLREIFEKYLYHWKWILVSVIIALILGMYFSRKQENVFELKSTVLVVDQSKNGGMNEMSMLKQLDKLGLTGSSASTLVNNEDQVMHSTALMKRVVNRLELYTSYSHNVYLKRHELYTESPLFVKLDSLGMSRLKGSLSLIITPDNKRLSIKGIYNDGKNDHPRITNFDLLVKKLPATVQTPAGLVTIQVRTGKSFPDETIEVGINDPNKVAKSLVTFALTTEVTKLIDVINLTLHINNIQMGQDILNTLMAIYNEDAIEQVNRSAINTATFIDGRLKYLSTELGGVEKNVEEYKQSNQLTDLSTDAKTYLEKSTAYDRQKVTVEMQLHLIKYVEEFIHNPANQKALIPNLGLTDVGLVSVIQQYNSLIMAHDRIADGSSEENPALKTLNQQIQSALKSIQISIANSRKGLQISNTDITTQNADALSKINSIPRKEREFIEIKRQQQVKETLYLFLLQKREEASLNMAVTVPKGRVLNTPDDILKIGPNTVLTLLIFFLFGLIIPIIIIFIKDLVNTSIMSRSQVEKLTTVPILAELGHNATDEILIDHRSVDTNAELFRLLRTKLQFTLDFPTQKVIMITSTEPGEGKTYVSLNLAMNLSLTDKKVLLIGMDLRKPKLTKYFELNSKEGISSYLSGHEPDYKKLIHSLQDQPMLDILPAGIIPPNPNELLMNKRLDSLIDELKKKYDYIVIDTAPVGAVSDTYLIDRLVDLTLYVCRAGYSDKRNLDYLNHLMQDGNLSRPYLIINDLDMQSRNYYYHRGYTYGYGNYYGHDKGKK